MSPQDFDTTSWDTWEGFTGSSRGLVDICSDAFSLIFHIHGGNDPGEPTTLRQEIALIFQEIEKRSRRQKFSREDIKAARYALCALIDETLQNSQWPHKDQWSEKPLQLEYFDDQLAGERFFDLLARIRKKGREKVDLLELFCVTLLLGFQGKYKLKGGDEIKRITGDLVRDINDLRGGIPPLSPHWKIRRETTDLPTNTVPRWVWISCLSAIGGLIVLYIAFTLLLRSSANNAVDLMMF